MLKKVTSFQQYKSMSLIQFAAKQQDTFDYISGPKAISDDLVQVKEISDSGSVNNLNVFNLSDKFVFFMEGDVLSGAKQNRTFNTSVLLAPNTKTNIPVSCVEAGRWTKRSEKFNPVDYVSPIALRAAKTRNVSKNLDEQGMHYSNQGEVWDDVNNYSLKFKVGSPTSNLSDIYAHKKIDFDELVNKFKADPEANGIAVFINRELLNIEVFNRRDIYSEYFPKLLRGTAMEAMGLKAPGEMLPEVEAAYKMNTFLDHLEDVQMHVHKGVGVGDEKRFETLNMTGLQLEYNHHLIHLTALNLGKIE